MNASDYIRLVSAARTPHHVLVAVRRFHVADLTAPLVRVAGDQARHALKVLRLRVGDRVVLFDGAGREAVGEIASATRTDFDVRVIEARDDEPAGPRLILAVCPPKGERADWMVEKLAELGVGELIPLLCGRSQVRPGEGKVGRWRRKAVEAAKQSRRASAMQVHVPHSLSDVLKQRASNAAILYGDTQHEGKSLLAALQDRVAWASRPHEPPATLILIGPEGGFTDAERGEIEHAGGCPFRLAASTLRIETAALAAAAVWNTQLL